MPLAGTKKSAAEHLSKLEWERVCPSPDGLQDLASAVRWLLAQHMPYEPAQSDENADEDLARDVALTELRLLMDKYHPPVTGAPFDMTAEAVRWILEDMQKRAGKKPAEAPCPADEKNRSAPRTDEASSAPRVMYPDGKIDADQKASGLWYGSVTSKFCSWYATLGHRTREEALKEAREEFERDQNTSSGAAGVKIGDAAPSHHTPTRSGPDQRDEGTGVGGAAKFAGVTCEYLGSAHGGKAEVPTEPRAWQTLCKALVDLAAGMDVRNAGDLSSKVKLPNGSIMRLEVDAVRYVYGHEIEQAPPVTSDKEVVVGLVRVANFMDRKKLAWYHTTLEIGSGKKVNLKISARAAT